jgi:hypothetical protein
MLHVEVVFAYPQEQHLLAAEVEAGSTVEAAIRASGMLDKHPEIDLQTMRVGVFGKLCALEDPVRDGDRVEIYRPLKADPKQARRERAAKARASS